MLDRDCRRDGVEICQVLVDHLTMDRGPGCSSDSFPILFRLSFRNFPCPNTMLMMMMLMSMTSLLMTKQ